MNFLPLNFFHNQIHLETEKKKEKSMYFDCQWRCGHYKQEQGTCLKFEMRVFTCIIDGRRGREILLPIYIQTRDRWMVVFSRKVM